jgi:membrane protease YdiL (CAAX protease family)
MDVRPPVHVAYAVMAVGFAPFAEEFLFRGLLYRALDREWSGWRAIIGAAAFFAVALMGAGRGARRLERDAL